MYSEFLCHIKTFLWALDFNFRGYNMNSLTLELAVPQNGFTTAVYVLN